MYVCISQKEVIIIRGQVIADAGTEEELFEVTDEIIIAVLYFVVPVPSVVDFLIA